MKGHKVTFSQMTSSVIVDHQSKFVFHFPDTKDYVMLNTISSLFYYNLPENILKCSMVIL